MDRLDRIIRDISVLEQELIHISEERSSEMKESRNYYELLKFSVNNFMKFVEKNPKKYSANIYEELLKLIERRQRLEKPSEVGFISSQKGYSLKNLIQGL
jgi:CRISPR/Cas system-associated protein Csm6